MITPDTFNNLDDFITIVNQMKLNKLTIAAFKVDKDRAFIDSGNGFEEVTIPKFKNILGKL
jgi:hypothetical protein